MYIVIKTERKVLYERVNKRCFKMIKEGVVEEVNEFFQKNVMNFIHPLHKAIGLSNRFETYLNGNLSKDNVLKFLRDTRRYAKRQLTWFNNRAKNAKHLGILDAENYILKNI